MSSVSSVSSSPINKVPRVPKLPVEIMDIIVSYTGDARVANALKGYITQYTLDRIEKNILIYGDVQGGKTAKIIKYIKENDSSVKVPCRISTASVKVPCRISTASVKVLVIQNSLLVLKQYEQRFKSQNIDYQIIDKNTTEITKNLVLILNNKYRYSYFKKIEPLKYILILDESDQTIRSCPLKNNKTVRKIVHVTATPFNNVVYDNCIQVPRHPDYYGLGDLNVNLNTKDNEIDYVNKFKRSETGIMLINKYSYVTQMVSCANTLANSFVDTPIVLLTSEKTLYLHNTKKILKFKSISKIIDSLKEHKHIIFVANRLSSRGLSYVSSDYTRHLTWQITKVRPNKASFLQSLRILGIYNSAKRLDLQLVISDYEEKLFQKHLDFINNFDIQKKMVYNL